MRRITLIFWLCLNAFAGHSQMGDFPVKNYTPNISGVDQTTYDIIFDARGLMYAATNSGVLRFDGTSWEFIKTPSAVFSLVLGPKQVIYVGCLGSFGRLELASEGLAYQQISPDSISDKYFFSSLSLGDSLLFVSSEMVCSYNPASGKVGAYKSPDKFEIESVIAPGNGLFLNTETGSYRWQGRAMDYVDDWVGQDYPPREVAFSVDSAYCLVLDVRGKLFSSGQKGFEEVDGLAGDITGISWVNDTLAALSTSNYGCMLWNARTRHLWATIDYKRGLPDNEIMAIEVDWAQGIWIAHAFGFSRVDALSPVRCLSNLEGLEGNLIQSMLFKNQLMVGTSTGLFRLVEDSVFSVNVSGDRIDSKKNRPKASLKSDDSNRQFAYLKRKYERVPEVITKCNKMLQLGDVLLIGTNGGLFEYSGAQTVRILEQPINQIVPLDESEFLVIDNSRQVTRFVRENGKYTRAAFGYESFVVSAYADNRGYIWLVEPEQIASVGLTIYGASVIDRFNFSNEFLETPTITEINGKLYFITYQGYFVYDYQNKQLERDSVLSEKVGLPLCHFKDQEGVCWIFDGELWKSIDQSGQVSTYSYLSLFPTLRFVSRGPDGNIYFINVDNQLYQYNPSDDHNELYQSSIFYKHLYAQAGFKEYRDRFSLNYDENYLSAEISQPDYLGLLKVEFQHQLEGIDKDWSDWSPNNKINLNHLPDGQYTLRVRSRDVFGRVQTIDPVIIEIRPPYWRTTWFYLLEVLIFASLVVVSTRLNQSKAQNRYLTEGLTILTIILIIESLQSAAGSYFSFASSPFIDFLINLTIAIIIFPLEQLLKKAIKSGKIPVKLKKPQQMK